MISGIYYLYAWRCNFMVMKMQGIIAGCGIKPDRYEAVQDDDINEAYCLYGENKKFFLKLNDAGLYPRK